MQKTLSKLSLPTLAQSLKPSLAVASLVLALAGCSATPGAVTPTQPATDNSQMIENTLTHCPTSRSEKAMCTMQYDPVCVKTKVGSVISYRTAGNACSACNIPEAISYTKGECS